MRIDGERLNARIQSLATIGQTTSGGVTRPSLSAEYLEAQDQVIEWMRQAGLETKIDAVGNIVGRRSGSESQAGAIMVGSHIDTVIDGGAFDGAVGVLAGIEVADALSQHSFELKRPLEVVAFIEEESTRWGMSLMGSQGMLGTLAHDDIFGRKDDNGVTIADALRSLGLDPERYRDATRSPRDLDYYLELHIEQGAVLDSLGMPLGVVTGIAAPIFMALTLEGKADHAGATPMHLRKDALIGAAELILAARRIAEEASSTSVATVGRCEVTPGATNVIPGRVRMSFDVRDMDSDTREGMLERLKGVVLEVAGKYSLRYEMSELARGGPVVLPQHMIDTVARCLERLGLPVFHLPSGASHDAQVMAQIADAAMIFVRSRDGVSHSPGEFSAAEDITAGAKVLLQTVLALDATERPTMR